MPRDINLAIVTGYVATTPAFVPIKNNKKILVFTLRNIERYELADGTPSSHENNIVVEVLGKNADKYVTLLLPKKRYVINGYLRVDNFNGEDRVRLRAYRIEEAD